MPINPDISPSNSLNKKNALDLRISEIANYITEGCKHLENNFFRTNKNDISKIDNSCNTL